MTEIIHNNLTRAYYYNKKAKEINGYYYIKKTNLILNTLRMIKSYKMDNIHYEIKELENSFSLIFDFDKNYNYKRFAFHLPLSCKNALNNI